MRQERIQQFLKAGSQGTIPYEPGTLAYINAVMSRYNAQVFAEILTGEIRTDAGEIDESVADKLHSCMELYFAAYAPSQLQLKQYSILVSTYLVCIAKKPLHPLGMHMQGGCITEQNGIFYCPAKRIEMQTENSVCRFCVCKNA
ncbi:MAG: DUF2115 family protein [Lachnospiraceae bacterium]